MNTRSIVVVFMATLILTGCASTVDYSESVTRLENAINDTAASVNAIDEDITARQNERLKKNIVAGKLLLEPADNECAAGREKCSLTVLKAENGKTDVVSVYPIKSSMPKGIKAIELIKVYVSRLKSIIDADTAAKVTASTNATLGSLEDIAKQLAKENGEATSKINRLSDYKEPASGFIEWLTEKHVERVKTEALATATLNAHKVIKDLTVFYSTAAQSQKLAEFAGFHKEFVIKQEQFDDKPPNDNSVDAYVLAASKYQIALNAQSANPLKAFEIAHEKLMNQLNKKGEKTSLAEVASAIEHLEQEAKKIKSLVESVKEISDKANKGGKS